MNKQSMTMNDRENKANVLNTTETAYRQKREHNRKEPQHSAHTAASKRYQFKMTIDLLKQFLTMNTRYLQIKQLIQVFEKSRCQLLDPVVFQVPENKENQSFISPWQTKKTLKFITVRAVFCYFKKIRTYIILFVTQVERWQPRDS